MSDLGNKRVMGNNIMFYLNRDGVTRKDLAIAIGVPYSTLTEWINARAYPRIDKIEKMANYFGIEKADLVERMDVEHGENAALIKRLVNAAKGCTPEQLNHVIALLESMKG